MRDRQQTDRPRTGGARAWGCLLAALCCLVGLALGAHWLGRSLLPEPAEGSRRWEEHATLTREQARAQIPKLLAADPEDAVYWDSGMYLERAVGLREMALADALFQANTRGCKAYGWTEMATLAAGNGDARFCETLRRGGVRPGRLALPRAAHDGGFAIATVLLAGGADPSGEAMLAAAREGDLQMMGLLMDAGAYPYSPWRGDEPVHAAVKARHEDAVRLLVDRGARADFMVASFLGDQDEARALLQRALRDLTGSGVDDPYELTRPLTAAVSNRCAPAVEMALSELKAAGVKPRLSAALGGAAEEGCVDILGIVAAHMDESALRGDAGRRAVACALENGQWDAIGRLSELGAPTDLWAAACAGSLERVRYLLDTRPGLRTKRGPDGISPLHAAAATGQTAVIEYLLGLGVSVNVQDYARRTPLEIACSRGQDAAAKLLLDHGALATADGLSSACMREAALHAGSDIFASLVARAPSMAVREDGLQPSPLQAAAQAGRLEAVRIMLAAGADPRATGHDPPALHVAAASGQVAVISCLLEHGLGPSERDPADATPLHYAARRGQTEAVRTLLAAGAKVDARDWARGTALQDAAWFGSADCVAELLAAGASVGRADKFGRTALHLAAFRGSADCCRLLLDAGADRGARDIDGLTPSQLARSMRWDDLADLLDQAAP
jgi:ankyrin repeat protein